MSKVNFKSRWTVGLGLLAILLGFMIWRVSSASPGSFFLLKFYQDHAFLREELRALGWLAPVIFIFLQALQVIISPIPGEVTGYLGGYLFGLRAGFIYSTIGLGLGTLVAFWIGRWLGAPIVARYLKGRVYERFRFLVQAEEAILVFIIYLIPGFPKDIVSYLFGISPIGAWSFAIASILGRMLGTWLLSAEDARTATGEYIQLALLIALMAAAAVPLYYHRKKIAERVRHSLRPERDRRLLKIGPEARGPSSRYGNVTESK